MAVSLIPYGRLTSGNYGINVEESTGKPLASVVEVLTTLPAIASTDNFPGRLVFETSSAILYVFKDSPSSTWTPLDGTPARVESVSGTPPIVPTPPTGDMLFDTDTEVLYLFDGSQWQGVGGRFAAQIITQRFVGDGLTTTYPLGVGVTVPADYVEAFWDGVRQYPNPSGDFNIVGTNIVFTNPVPTNVVALIRTTVSDPLALSQNAQISRAFYTAGTNQDTFASPEAGSASDSVFVFVDGVLQSEGVGADFQLSQQDTTISDITKTALTVATATTAAPHGIAVGGQVTIGGVSESDFEGTVTVTATPLTTTFEYTVVNTAPASGTANPIMFFTPAQTNDDVIFNTPLTGGQNVEIRVIKNAVVAPSTGEINDGSNLGFGIGLFSSKSGLNLQFKSLLGGNNVVLSDSGSDVTINSLSGATFESRSGINTSFYLVSTTDSYVGVRNTTDPVTIDLSPIINDPSNSGRRIVIKDESGGAAINNISIVSAGSLIDGSSPPYVISSNYGSVTLVKDGTNWFITSTI